MSEYRFAARSVFLLAGAFCTALLAQPQLTTIEDTIYRADGQRFDGLAVIEWRSFLAADATSIAAYSKTVRVVGGVLKVNLTPTTTASAGAYYLVKYTINGRLQTVEYWAVRPSTTALKLRDIRLAGPPVAGAAASVGLAGQVTITDVTGLADELAARARKGIGFVPSGVAVINSSGELETANGQPTDCVKVDGTTGPCGEGGGGAGAVFVDAETPAGLINGSNTVFTLADAPTPATSLQLYRNGVLQKPGTDYALVNNTVTFTSASVPQPADVLQAVYRLGQSGGVTGQAGGALTGYFPSPSLAPGAVSNLHVAATAAISETKLALNYPTHSNQNDPTPDQKSALLGTTGTPGNANRYVTDGDPRLTDARTPSGHGLLSGAHFDANPGAGVRGDLIVAQGTSPTLWSRLALGAANRCLTSNGSDAVWNTCLFTGFPAGSIPFVDGTGNLAHNNSRLSWDNASRRMGIGSGNPSATLMVYDAAAGEGRTTLTVRAGQDQQSNALQRWQDTVGADVATISPDGSLDALSVKARTTATKAGWRETGSSTDPSPAADGDAWLNTTEQARRMVEGGQTHSLPQVICSIGGTGTSSSTQALLGRCRVPAALVRSGDRFEVKFHVTHEGSAEGFSFVVKWGGVTMVTGAGSALETASAGRADAVPQGAVMYWSSTVWGGASALLSGAGSGSVTPGADMLVDVLGQMAGPTGDTLTLRGLSVVRLPNQSNP